MKNVIILAFIASLLVFTIGCTSSEAVVQKPEAVDLNTRINTIESEIQAMINHAEKARKKAASVGGEWRDIHKFIKKAKKALAAGKYEKAIALAKKSIRQAEMGYKQMMDQKNSYMPGYFKFKQD